MNRLTPFVIQKIEEKLDYHINDKGACAELRRSLHNSETDDGQFALNTIKRWFGLIEKQVEPQQNGLEAIAEYLGYPSWAALTQESEYNQQKEKTEEDYISELLSNYSDLVQSIKDYQFQKEQAKSKQDAVRYEIELKKLRQKQYTIKDAIVKLADILTDPTPYQSDSGSIESFFEGKHYEEANELLDTDKLKEEQAVLLRAFKKESSDKTEIQKQLKKNAYCFYIKAEICKAWYNWDEAKEYYLLSLDSQRVFDTLFALGELYLNQNKGDKEAFPLFEEILKNGQEILKGLSPNFCCTPAYRVSLYINTLFYMAKIHFLQKNYKKGMKLMDTLVLTCTTKTEGSFQKEMQLRIGDVYTEQGNAFEEQKDYKNAELFLRKSLAAYKPYSMTDYAETSINLAYVYAAKGDFELAEKELNQSLEYFNTQFKKDDPVENQQKYRLRTAKCHFALGFVNYKKKDYQESILSYNRALISYEKMDKTVPSTETKLEIVKAYSVLSNLYTHLNSLEKAQECYEKCGELLRDEGVAGYLFDHEPKFKEMVIKELESKNLI
jgi:tetratricopeptide (TPR) repeat protein